MRSILFEGNGGREASLACRVAQDEPGIVVNAVMAHENPTLVDLVERTGGAYEIGDFTSPPLVTNFAVRNQVDFAVVSNDDALANGVVDALRSEGIPTVGPDQRASRVEWDKVYARQLFDEIDHSLNPLYRLAGNDSEVKKALGFFEENDIPVVVKPLGLTGGKGVKVMGPHFGTYAEAHDIGTGLLSAGDKTVLFEERVDPRSVEYTVQAYTDGKTVIHPPLTVDYPYRFDGDTGPGTGGMGVFTERGLPSYLSPAEFERTQVLSDQLVQALAASGLRFSGILNIGLFATPRGIKIIETNARPGDPECMNIMMLMKGNFASVLGKTVRQELASTDFSYEDAASILVYLVNKNYALGETPDPATFTVDHDVVEKTGAKLFFSAAQKASTESEYVTVGTSRALAVGAVGETLREARETVYRAIKTGIRGSLDYRRDIGDPDYVRSLAAHR
jgi:phosphoribosylamine--glycine ligase